MKFIISHIVLSGIVFVYLVILKLLKALVYECSQSSCLLVSSQSFVYQCVSKLLLLVFVSNLLSTRVCESSCLHMSISKFLSIMCLKALVYLCLHQSSCLLMYVSKLLSTSVCLHEFWKEVMNFEAHHKHGLLYHIVFAKMYERL